jgi:FMN-dependent NADH-azoreductase
MNILHIDSSASDALTSHSRRLSSEIVETLKAVNPGASVTYRDVAADQLPHIDLTVRQAWTPEAANDATLASMAKRSRALVEELKAADVIVIGSPMYNFSVPSTLKAWIDHVAIAGQTFRYSPTGAQGLLKAKAYLALSSGGIYSQGPSAGADHLATYLTAILGLLGITEVEVVRAEGVAYGPEKDEAVMKTARERIGNLVAA